MLVLLGAGCSETEPIQQQKSVEPLRATTPPKNDERTESTSPAASFPQPSHGIVLPVASTSVVPEFRFEVTVTIEGGACRVDSELLRDFWFRRSDGSLRDLSVALELARDAHQKSERSKGRTGVERVNDAEISTLRVLIHAPRDTPWQHIAFVSVVLFENRYHRLWLACNPCATSSYSDKDLEQLELQRCSKAPPETALALYPGDAHRDVELHVPWPLVEVIAKRKLRLAGKLVDGFDALSKRIGQIVKVANPDDRAVFVIPKRSTRVDVMVACLNAAEKSDCGALWPAWIPPPKSRRLPAMPTPRAGS